MRRTHRLEVGAFANPQVDGRACPRPLNFLRRPAIRLRGGASHKHGSFAGAQAVGFQERLNGLLVIDDSEGSRPVRAPQAAIETPGIEYAGKRVPDSGNGYGSFDSVQAPLILITAFLRLASSTTFGRSAQGSGGAGGAFGWRMPDGR